MRGRGACALSAYQCTHAPMHGLRLEPIRHFHELEEARRLCRPAQLSCASLHSSLTLSCYTVTGDPAMPMPRSHVSATSNHPAAPAVVLTPLGICWYFDNSSHPGTNHKCTFQDSGIRYVGLGGIYRKYSGAGFFAGTPLTSCGAASKRLKVRSRCSSSSRIAATLPQR